MVLRERQSLPSFGRRGRRAKPQVLRGYRRLLVPLVASSESDRAVDVEKLISLLGATGVDSQLKLAEKMRRLYFEEIRRRLTKTKIIRRPRLAVALLEMHRNEKFESEVEKLSGQRKLPVIEFEDGSIFREESKSMAETIKSGRLMEKRGAAAPEQAHDHAGNDHDHEHPGPPA